MDENLVGYVLNALEPEQHQQVEQYLKDHPEARDRLTALRRALRPLEADKDIEPPPMLAFHTIAKVAEYRCRPLPKAPAQPAGTAPSGPARWWRRPDVLIAACLLIAIAGVGIPGLVQLNRGYHIDACADNLREFHTALTSYSANHGGDYPGFQPVGQHHSAGMFVPHLLDASVPLQKVSTTCPAVGPRTKPEHSLKDLKNLSPEDFEKIAPKLSGCYAYSLGYVNPRGSVSGLHRTLPGELNNNHLPVMADKPSIDGDQRGNSPNHGGQNVLYVGGHVKFHTSPNAGIDNDDIYTNKDGKVGAGLDRWDTVLGTSADRP